MVTVSEDTDYEHAEFARTEAGHRRPGMAGGIRQAIWVQLKVDVYVRATSLTVFWKTCQIM